MALRNVGGEGTHTIADRDSGSPESTATSRHRWIRRRMDRPLPDLTTPPDVTGDELAVEFPQRPGVRKKQYDLGALGLPQDIAQLLAHAVRNHPEAVAQKTQENYWGAIRTFARFVQADTQTRSNVDLTTSMVERYGAWLVRQTNRRTKNPWTQTSQSMVLRTLRRLIDTIKTISPEQLPSDIAFPSHLCAYREPAGGRPRLNEGQLKSLLWACQQEIREIRTRFRTGQEILKGDSTGHDPKLCKAIELINDLNNIGFPSRKALEQRGLTQEVVQRLGGTRCLRTYLSLTAETALPYFVALLALLAGNVQPVLGLTRDCVQPAPLDDDEEIICWEKPRAGRAVAHMQTRQFKSSKPYGPPALIKDLLAMTDPHVARVEEQYRSRLFLVGNDITERFGPLTYATIVSYRIKPFLSRVSARIEEWNRDHPKRNKAGLPEFDLRDLRRSNASEHYAKSGGDVRAAQRVLNHRSAQTTLPYIDNVDDVNARIIFEAQRSLVDHACSHVKGTNQATDGESRRNGASASFGHECRDPTLPRTRGEPRLCPHFQQCLDCPGLVIPLDARHLALVLRAKNAFESACKRLHPERWKMLYADSHRRLVKDILPEFPKELEPEANTILADLPPLPELE